ncbi:MAG: WYL domain-containing transcriptional regulator [Prevotella sp.]|nr:WYL domain-containing transcriptional regulator [Prevotellaceae bacterium]MDY3935695.1 WYL domain-containing transcriptional regulator [Prevotella sp.]
MRFNKLRAQLDLILLLADGRGYSVAELCQRVGISVRNLYYLLEFLKTAGFTLFKANGKYHIDWRSPFFTQLTKTIQFSDAEMRTIYSLLTMAGNKNDTVNQLRTKIDNVYNFSVFLNSPKQKQIGNHVKLLEKAIHMKRMVKIIGYSSPNSQSVKDRIVEPFYIMNNTQDVRCYELVSKSNKTFRINRMEAIEELDADWLHEDAHRQIFTDIFMFSGETRQRVELRLGQLARNIFIEEYPQGVPLLSPEPDGLHWRLSVEVCDFRGLGRFVLGLFTDIEILSNTEFKSYIQQKILEMQQRIAMPDASVEF